MKFATVFALLLASASAFQAPLFATRAVGKAPATKAVAKKKFSFKKAPAKKAPAKKFSLKKAAPAKKAPPASSGYITFTDRSENFKFGRKISGGAAGKTITPVFVHPTLNTEPPPSFDYKEAAKARKTPQMQEFVYDDGLTELERKQIKTIPAFLTGSARSRVEAEAPRDDIELSEYPFGLDGDRFQLLFISIFSLFTLVGCLSGTVSLD